MHIRNIFKDQVRYSIFIQHISFMMNLCLSADCWNVCVCVMGGEVVGVGARVQYCVCQHDIVSQNEAS